LWCCCAIVRLSNGYSGRKALQEMLRGQEGAQPGPHHPWSDDKHMVHESVFVTCGNTAPYFYRLFFSIENKSEGDVRKNSEQGSDGW
jgi:hypothetical protein